MTTLIGRIEELSEIKNEKERKKEYKSIKKSIKRNIPSQKYFLNKLEEACQNSKDSN